MKNVMKLYGIILVMAVSGLLMTACDNGNNGDTQKSWSPYLGEKLEIAAPVYRVEWDWETDLPSVYEYTGNLMINDDDVGGVGEIKDGKLTYTIEAPVLMNTIEDIFITDNNVNDFLRYSGFYSIRDYKDITASIKTVKCAILNLFYNYSDSYTEGLSLVNFTENVNPDSGYYTVTYTKVFFVYVEHDVTISGKGITITDDIEDDFEMTSTDFHLALKQGWNVIHKNGTTTRQDRKYFLTEQITMGTPMNNLKWVLGWWASGE